MGKWDRERREYREAKRNLERVNKREHAKARARGERTYDESNEAYRAANRRVNETADKLPWHRR